MAFSEKDLQIRRDYPLGSRIEIKSILNSTKDLFVGLRGTVNGYGENLSLFVRWENDCDIPIHPYDDNEVLKIY